MRFAYSYPWLILLLCLFGCGERSTGSKQFNSGEGVDLLIKLSHTDLAGMDIARVNLACTTGLPNAEPFDMVLALGLIDQMAARVKTETERHLYRFKQSPAEFENSEGFFRMTMLMVVLAEDFQIHYAANKVGIVTSASMRDGFFANPADVFLHGLTGPKRQGTCSSLPVLHVAVGRRLGYPLKLVTTKGHLFVRWEGATERFNFEAAGNGANRFPDEYYRHWPLEASEQEIQAEGYLKSLTAAEELGVFLSIRGMCFAEVGRYKEASEAFGLAAKFAPACVSYSKMRDQLKSR